MMSKESVEINTKINELYSKTIITQKLINESENPLELKIYIYNDNRLLFSSFSSKIGDSITVRSKVIKKEKGKEKYTDSISSGNAAIFVTKDPNSNRMIVNLGNIPPKQEVIFISEFLQFMESSNKFEFELFRNLPVLLLKDSAIQPFDIKGIVEIKTKDAIKIDKIILSENLNIIKEEYIYENKNNYLIKYEYKNLPKLIVYKHLDYIPSNKIYFEIENNSPILFYQKSSIKEDEINYMIKYKYIQKKLNNNLNLYPALYIFLIDQSSSMRGEPLEVAVQALILFLQSLPAGSYYQIIGFGTYYKLYDKSPKEYTQKNIEESIGSVKTLYGDLGGTDIYSPLNYIYHYYESYDKLKLPINIFLLTDGEIENKDDTLKLIEQHSNEFSIYSIGIGEYFDSDLIKNAGILGKGNYNFCPDIKKLKKVVATEIKNSSIPFYSDLELETPLEEKCLYKIKDNPLILKNNIYYNFLYINENNGDVIDNSKIKLEFKYKLYNEIKEISEKYELKGEELPLGEELSKLIIKKYINDNKEIEKEKKIELSLKYQILTIYTSLFAEIKLSEKISEEMKKEIINNDTQKSYGLSESDIILENSTLDKNIKNTTLANLENDNQMKELECMSRISGAACPTNSLSDKFVLDDNSNEKSKKSFGFFSSIGNSIKGLFSNKNEFNLKNQECVMKIINTQNFVEGFWDLNEFSEKIKDKYKRQFKLLKELKDKNINDQVAITILIIYFIKKEHKELLDELVMIIQKAELFITKSTNDNYENIIKEVGMK